MIARTEPTLGACFKHQKREFFCLNTLRMGKNSKRQELLSENSIEVLKFSVQSLRKAALNPYCIEKAKTWVFFNEPPHQACQYATLLIAALIECNHNTNICTFPNKNAQCVFKVVIHTFYDSITTEVSRNYLLVSGNLTLRLKCQSLIPNLSRR